MPAFIIYEKPNQSFDDTIKDAVMVEHRFSYMIFLLPALWMLLKRLWLPLIAYILLSVALAMLDGMIPFWVSMLVSLIIALWISVEAPNLMDWALKRRGYREVGLIYADNKEHCEARYIHAKFANAQRDVDPSRPDQTSAHAKIQSAQTKSANNLPVHKDQDQQSVIGLFPTSENA
ncbi:MAG: DUF2628 domain-containing protein [Cohaesibacter sp.]|nr:DUF2628 domain-containing protein [Cohaesibacter sp.]